MGKRFTSKIDIRLGIFFSLGVFDWYVGNFWGFFFKLSEEFCRYFVYLIGLGEGSQVKCLINLTVEEWKFEAIVRLRSFSDRSWKGNKKKEKNVPCSARISFSNQCWRWIIYFQLHCIILTADLFKNKFSFFERFKTCPVLFLKHINSLMQRIFYLPKTDVSIKFP